MRKNIMLRLMALVMLLVACSKEQTIEESRLSLEEDGKAFVADLSLGVGISTEIPIVEVDRLRGIGVEREMGKFVAKFYEGVVPFTIELRDKNNPSVVYVAQHNQNIEAEAKSIELRASRLTFYRLGANAEERPMPQQAQTWQLRLTAGGTLNRESKQLKYQDNKPMMREEDLAGDLEGYYRGVLPFSSAEWTDVEFTDKGFNAKRQGDSYIPITLKPQGNFLRIKLQNKHSLRLKVRKVSFESNDVSSRGALLLGQDDLKWTALDESMQMVSKEEEQSNAYLVNLAKDAQATMYLWVAQVSDAPAEPYTKVMLDIEEDAVGGLMMKDLLVYQKYERGNLPTGKSSPLSVSIAKEIAIQPIFYMAHNFLYGDANNTSSYRFATGNSSNTFVDDGSMGNYYSVGEANTITQKVPNVTINGAKWYMPLHDDVAGVFPYYKDNTNLNGLLGGEGKVVTNMESLNLEKPWEGNKTKYKSIYVRPNDATHGGENDVVYALRFLAEDGSTTPYTAAFKYQRVGDWVDGRNQNGRHATLQIRVRPFGTFGARETLDAGYLTAAIANSTFWSNNTSGDIVRELPARGRDRGSYIQNNGQQMVFWTAKQIARAEDDDCYQVQNSQNASFTFFNSGGGGGGVPGAANSSATPILLFRNRADRQ